MSEAALKESGTEPLARIVDYEIVGVPPEIMGIGPVPAVRAILARQELSLADIDLIEVNEAFAAQVIASDRDLQFDPETDRKSTRLNSSHANISYAGFCL